MRVQRCRHPARGGKGSERQSVSWTGPESEGTWNNAGPGGLKDEDKDKGKTERQTEAEKRSKTTETKRKVRSIDN